MFLSKIHIVRVDFQIVSLTFDGLYQIQPKPYAIQFNSTLHYFYFLSYYCTVVERSKIVVDGLACEQCKGELSFHRGHPRTRVSIQADIPHVQMSAQKFQAIHSELHSLARPCHNWSARFDYIPYVQPLVYCIHCW